MTSVVISKNISKEDTKFVSDINKYLNCKKFISDVKKYLNDTDNSPFGSSSDIRCQHMYNMMMYLCHNKHIWFKTKKFRQFEQVFYDKIRECQDTMPDEMYRVKVNFCMICCYTTTKNKHCKKNTHGKNICSTHKKYETKQMLKLETVSVPIVLKNIILSYIRPTNYYH